VCPAINKVPGMLPDFTNISVELVLYAAVLPHMLAAHRPAIVHSSASPNAKANSFNYLSFGIINRLNATQAFT